MVRGVQKLSLYGPVDLFFLIIHIHPILLELASDEGIKLTEGMLLQLERETD